MDSDYTTLAESINYLDSISKETVDDLIRQLYNQKIEPLTYRNEVNKKVAQFHRSGYDIEATEYLREKFGISREDKKIKKAVYKRGRNSMFQRLDEEEQKRLDQLCEEYDVSEQVERAKKNPFNRFVKWYNEFEKEHKLFANLIVSFTAWTYGDFMTQMATTGSYEFRDLAIIGPLAVYYGWETPKAFDIIDKKIPISKYKISAKEWLNPKLLWRNLKEKKGDILRIAAFRLYGIFLWGPRHFAALELKKDQPLDLALDNLATFDFAKISTAVQIGQLPISIPLLHFIQNKIDLQYAFLAYGTYNMIYSSVVSLVSYLA